MIKKGRRRRKKEVRKEKESMKNEWFGGTIQCCGDINRMKLVSIPLLNEFQTMNPFECIKCT